MDTPAIEASGLGKSFGDTRAVHGVDLAVPTGTLTALLGPNGSGKTTTVRILTTLLRADEGTARVAGHDVVTEAAAVRGRIGLTAQQASVDEKLTARENLELFGGLNHLGRRGSRRRAAELLERFGLADAADRRVAHYSGGMRRRLDLAASMVAEPRILFLDEPTTGLDPRSRVELWDVVGDLLAAGTTILLTTQYLEEADRLADHVVIIEAGRIVEQDTPSGLKRRVGTERLVLTPADRARAASVAELLPDAHLDRPTGELTVNLQDPDHLRRVLDRLHSARIDIAEVRLASPTLDDVFFELTGGPAGRADASRHTAQREEAVA